MPECGCPSASHGHRQHRARRRLAAKRWLPQRQGHPGGGSLHSGTIRPGAACAHLLGDADVEGALGEALLEAVHAGAATHGRVDAHHPAVQLRLGDQGVRKVVGVAAGLQQRTSVSVCLHRYPSMPRETDLLLQQPGCETAAFK